MTSLLTRLGISLPIIQAPMAGVSTPQMAAAVSNSGGLGSIGIGNVDAGSARKMIRDLRSRTNCPFNVNVFCHQPAIADPGKQSHWVQHLSDHFKNVRAEPPHRLQEIYTSFLIDDAMLAMLVEERPPIVSFHFGLPSAGRIAALKSAGILLLATATNLFEAHLIEEAGVDAIVAQGYEAGGHRGIFDPDTRDDRLGTMALTRLLSKSVSVPIIAAGGIMDGAGIAASLILGASAAQLGTAFILCPESAADEGYRSALQSEAAQHTIMTRVISGRPARSLPNHFTKLEESINPEMIPDYPIAYDAAKSLHAAGKLIGEFGFGAQWAGQGAPLAQSLPAADLMRRLAQELFSGR